MLPHPVYWLKWGLGNFLSRSNLSPYSLCLLNSWDYRYEPQHISAKGQGPFVRIPPHPSCSLPGLFCCCCCFETGLLLCSLHCPQITILLLQPPKCWDCRHMCTTMPCLVSDFFFGRSGIWTQGLMFARQALYHFSHSASPFLCSVLLR
jgi:hypothetical protein